MTFSRPTPAQIVDSIQTEFDVALPGADARLRRSVEFALSRSLAMAIHELYGYLDYISRQILVSTADTENLERHASEWGILRKSASPASGPIQFTGTNGSIIPAGAIVKRSDDIEYTVDWLKGLLTTEPLLTPTLLETSRGFRVFAPIEAEAISAEVQGFLLFLEQSEVLTASQRERVIERITACQDTEMPLEKVKLIVLMVLWAEQQTPDDLWLTELLLPADALPLQ